MGALESMFEDVSKLFGGSSNSGKTAAEVTQEVGSPNTGFWSGILDDFSDLAGSYIKSEIAKNQSQVASYDLVSAVTTQTQYEDNPNIVPLSTKQYVQAYQPQQSFLGNDGMMKVAVAIFAGLALSKM